MLSVSPSMPFSMLVQNIFLFFNKIFSPNFMQFIT